MRENIYNMNDDLLVKYLVGEAGTRECRKVEEWLRADPANQQYYDHFRLIWEESIRLAGASTADENAAWERFRKKVVRAQKKNRPLAWLQGYPARVAAAVVLFLTAGWLIWSVVRQPGTATVSLASTQRVLDDTLSDGSRVTLNKRSVLTYSRRFNRENRSVTLEGEAFFDIVRNPQKPFIIHVADATVEVLGTSFNVRSRENFTEVIVENGLVHVTYLGQSRRLHAGEKGIINHRDHTLVKENNRDQLYRYYRSKEFVCEDTPLSRLIGRLNEAYDADIRIGDPALEQEEITVTFKGESLDTILNVISETYDISVERRGEQVILK